MHLLYIHQYFKTPKEPGGTRSYWIAQKLIEAGHRVTMLTTSSSIKTNKEEKIIDGIHVIYLKISYSQNMSITSRFKSFFSFMLKSTILALKIKEIDLVIATSTPLTVGFPAMILNKFKNIPYVFEIRDLWPEVPIQMGGLKNPILRKLAVAFERNTYKNAVHIVALSPGMAEGALRYESNNKVSVIPNMAKIDFFWPREDNHKLREELGLQKNSFKVIHFGSLGLANEAIYIIKAAELLKNEDSIEFVFIGGGSTENELEEYCKAKSLHRVHFLGKFSLDNTSEIVNLCHVSVVSFKNLPILNTNSPNKLFDSLSAGKPIIVNSAGWTKEMVEENKCGFYVDPNKPRELMECIKYLQENKKVLQEMGNKSRELAESKYDKSILCAKFVALIEEIGASKL